MELTAASKSENRLSLHLFCFVKFHHLFSIPKVVIEIIVSRFSRRHIPVRHAPDDFVKMFLARRQGIHDAKVSHQPCRHKNLRHKHLL